MKKKLSQKPSARLMRQAVAYDRLAAKAYHNRTPGYGKAYAEKARALKDKARRLQERGE
jgi:hypothetical protein